MPYILQKDRDLVDQKIQELADIINHRISIGLVDARPGLLNYVISSLGLKAYERHPISYKNINEFCGVLTCVLQEFYRKLAARYENIKAAENGDIYQTKEI